MLKKMRSANLAATSVRKGRGLPEVHENVGQIFRVGYLRGRPFQVVDPYKARRLVKPAAEINAYIAALITIMREEAGKAREPGQPVLDFRPVIVHGLISLLEVP